MLHHDRRDGAVKTLRATRAAILLALAGCAALLGGQAAAASRVSPLPPSDYGVRSVCAAPGPGHAGCLALELVPKTPAARAHSHPLGMTRTIPSGAGSSAEPCVAPTPANGCYGLRPQDFRSAYQLPSSAPSLQTIAIVDPYNNLGAQADLEKYDQEFGLPACTTQNGCFGKVNEHGETGNLPYPKTVPEREAREFLCKSKGQPKCKEAQEAQTWAIESALDIEIAHAICQNCHILLVEAASNAYPNLEEAERSAAGLGATEISNSWTETKEPLSDSAAFDHPGVVVTAAAGDRGYLNWQAPNAEERGVVNYPASSPHVVAVGGTRLSSEEGVWKEERVWNGGCETEPGPAEPCRGATGSGCSEVFAAPPWQLGTSTWPSVGCGYKRAVADVSADADPSTGAAIYSSADSECASHWCTLGGTSLSSPLIAAVFALAGGANGVEYPARTLYGNVSRYPGALHDVVVGSNGKCLGPASEGIAGCSIEAEAASCSGQAICLAAVGYDGPSGVGTPDGIAAFQPFAGGAGRSGTDGSGDGSELPSRPPPNNSTQSPAPASGPPASSSPGRIAQAAIRISGLALNPRAIMARNGRRPRASQIGFTFTINVAAPVRVTLARRIGARGHQRWKLLHDSLTILARGGRNGRNLRGKNTLAPGVYRLTLTPAHGTGQSILIQVR
jgi:hypothetical protein